MWEAASGKALGEPLRHEGLINSANFSFDGTRVVTASDDKTVRVWDAASGKPLGEPFRHEASVRSAKFSADGARIVTISDENRACVWDAAAGKLLGEPLSGVYCAALNPDGNHLVANAGSAGRVWDFAPRMPVVMPPAVSVWARGIAGLQYRNGELEVIPFDERRALLKTPLPPGPWQELQSWLKTSGPQRKLTPSSGLTIRQIAERERDFGSRESLESALQYDLTVPLARMMLGNLNELDELKRAKEPNQPAVDPSILARAAHWRRYDLDRLPNDPDLWERAAKSLRELPDSKVGVGPHPITSADAALQADRRAAELRERLKSP